jgi:hypothetical protein
MQNHGFKTGEPSMLTRALLSVAVLTLSTPAFADQVSPVFGSSTQAPVIIAINPQTGLPVASADLPKPMVASAQ